MDRDNSQTLEKSIIVREGYIITLCFLVFFLPQWCILIGTTLGILFFREYFESFVPLMLYDLVYAGPEQAFFGSWFSITIIYIVCFMIFEYGFKPRISYYASL